MNEARRKALEDQKRTLATLKSLDENIVMLDYSCDYGLDEIIARAPKSMIGLARSVQKVLHAPALVPNPTAEAGGCSTFNAKTPDGKVLMGRNYDLKETRALVLWTQPEKGYKSLSVCNQNMMLYLDIRRSRRGFRSLGAPYLSMDGMNEKGLAGAILMLITKPTKQNTGKPVITTSVALRGILDTCKNVEEAISFMSKFDMHDLMCACYHYFFTDAEGKSAIVEYKENEMFVYRQERPDDNLKLTNFFLTPGGKCREMGRDRFETMDCALKEKPVLTEDEAMELLRAVSKRFRSRNKLYFVATDWSVVYNCTDRSILMCAGMDYSIKYRMFVDKPCFAETVDRYESKDEKIP